MKKMFKAVTAIALSSVLSLGVAAVPAERDVFAVTAEAASEKLSSPENIVTTSTENSLTITWDKVSGATSYRIYRYDLSARKWKKWKETNETTFTAVKQKPGTMIYFKIASMKNKKRGMKVM